MTNRIEIVDNEDGTTSLTFEFEGEEHKSLITMDFKILIGVFTMMAENDGSVTFGELTDGVDAEVIPIPNDTWTVD